MKSLKLVFFVFLLLVVGVVLGKNVIAKMAVETGVEFATGLPLKLAKFDIGIRNTLIDIEGMKIYNPKGFEEPLMGSIPKIYVDYHLTDILKGTIHLEAIELHMEEFVVIKNASGALNINSMKTVQKQKQATAQAKPAPKSDQKIQIDRFQLKIGKVVYKDYSLPGGKPVVQNFNLNLSEEFLNVDNIEELTRIILIKVMTSTTIGRLTNFDVAGLSSSVTDVLGSSRALAGGLITDATGELGSVSGQALDLAAKTQAQLTKGGVEEAAAKAQETAEQAAASLKKNLTGGLKKFGAALKEE